MKIDVITNDAALERLWADWTSLWHQAGDASPFVSPWWLQAWWRQFGTSMPVVAVAWNGKRLIGILPMYRLDGVMLPMGVGISDEFDVLLATSAPTATADALLAAALEESSDTRCDFPELRDGAALRGALPPARWEARNWTGSPCPVLALQPVPALPKSIRRDLRQAQHRANRAGGWQIEYAGLTNFQEVISTLYHLHTLRWQGKGQGGVLDDPRVRRFHLDAFLPLLAAGLARVAILHLCNQPAAAIYALLQRNRILFYLSGFNPAFAFESPGTILLGHLIEEAFTEGRIEADFLRGGERYKYAWGGLDRFNTGRSFIR